MTDISEKAFRAKRLRDDELFKEFIAEVREDAIQAFVTSGPGDAGTREDAHAIVRALAKLEARLDAAIDAKALQNKRDQDRGND